jgi:hypothetical protein
VSEWPVAFFRAGRSPEDDRWGPKQVPTFLGWAASVDGGVLRVERFVIVRGFKAGWRKVTLTRGKKEQVVVVAYVDANTPGFWGDGEFRVRKGTE